MRCYCWMLKNCFIYLVVFDFLLCTRANPSENHKLLVLVLGGFHYDFIKYTNTTANYGFNRIQNLGFVQETVKNEFVTSMGPNLFSLVTGCHSESHGIVDDVFFDKKLNATFDLHSLSVSSQSVWYNPKIKPLWVVNQQNGHQSLVTSQWPGAAAIIGNLQPTYISFDNSLPLRTVIDKALNLLQDKVTLSLIYYDEPKLTAKKFGLASQELQTKIGQLDADIDHLIFRIHNSAELQRSLNVMVTSDHGIASVQKEHIVILDELLSRSKYRSPGPDVRVVWPVWPAPGEKTDSLFNLLLNSTSDRIEVKHKHDMKHLHYANNDRIAPIIAYAKPGWLIARSSAARDNFDMSGAYGYDPGYAKMSPFLMAFGPGIKKTTNNPAMDLRMVDLYPFICQLLNLRDCGQHNGSLTRMQHLLRTEESKIFATLSSLLTVGLVIVLCTAIAALFITYTCRSYCSEGWNTFAVLQRRSRRRRKSKKQSMVVMHRTPDEVDFGNQSQSSGQFLIPVSDNEEVELLASLPGQSALQQEHQQRQYRVDDATLINMLHGPKTKYP